MTWLSSLFILSALLAVCRSANILCVMPFPSRSHTLVITNVCSALADKHKVTVVTSYPSNQHLPNYTQVDVSDLAVKLAPRNGFDIYEIRHTPSYIRFPFLFYMGLDLMDGFLSHQKLQDLINSDATFDLIISETFVNEGVYAGLSQRFQAPIVLICPFQPNLWANYMVGNPGPSSYVPDTFLLFGSKMNFWERLANTVFTWYHEFVYKCLYLPRQDALMKRYFGNDLPPLTDIMKNVSAVLVNHHFSLAFPRPYTPNMIEVAGLHIKPVGKLSQDIQEFLDNAKDGAIFFSFGSNVHTSRMPKKQLQVFIEVFSKLKMKILWKWELDTFPNKPDNVKYSKWFPQSDILAHPNLKLFITHGGLGSTIESVYRGVPTISIPIFAEQELNANHVEKAGFSRTVNFDTLTHESLHEAIIDVVNNPKYREKVKQGSELLRDRPLSARETAVFWIEYVLRHQGAGHMKSSAQDLTWYQLYLLDVYAAILAVLATVTSVGVCLVKKCCRKFREKKHDQVKKNK